MVVVGEKKNHYSEILNLSDISLNNNWGRKNTNNESKLI